MRQRQPWEWLYLEQGSPRAALGGKARFLPASEFQIKGQGQGHTLLCLAWCPAGTCSPALQTGTGRAAAQGHTRRSVPSPKACEVFRLHAVWPLLPLWVELGAVCSELPFVLCGDAPGQASSCHPILIA